MTIQEYRNLWKEAIHLSEIEPNEEEAKAFVHKYYNHFQETYGPMSNRELLITFVGLVVYETKFCGNFGYGSCSPASWCYQELLARVKSSILDKEFVYDVGDWAADYSTNPYIPMGTRKGFGPRRHYEFYDNLEKRVVKEIVDKENRKAKLLELGRKKVEAAKLKHQKRLYAVEELRNKPITKSIKLIENSGKPIFYYIELIQEWFVNNMLDENQKKELLSFFPIHTTKHNKKLREKLEGLIK